MEDDPFLIRQDIDEKHYRSIESVVKNIKSYTLSNFEYYKAFDDCHSMRFVKYSSFLLEFIDNGLLSGIKYVSVLGGAHDYDIFHAGNGYRSLVSVVEKCCIRILTMVRFISNKRSTVFFRHETHSKELESFVNMLGQLKACLHFAPRYSELLDGKLVESNYNEKLYRMMLQIENLSQEPFFGHSLGFQFCESMQKPLNMMHLLLACYSEGFNKTTAFMKVAASLLHSGKFYLSPELRSKKVVSATIDGDIAFCKSFWSLSENNLLHNLTKFISPTVALETTFNIPTDPVHISLVSDPSKTLTVQPSSVNGGSLPIPVRLLSNVHRKGQLQQKSASLKPVSDVLIIHCHGGGFIAQSSLSHAGYLRHWTNDLDCPIVSIDYSLAPEYAYPRQVEEIFFAYCWILNNLEVFGTTGETIILVGDSAGANLVLTAALKIIEKGVRKPDGVLCVYGCFLVRYSPTPSRLLSLSDPILPFGILTKCLTAYIGIDIRFKEHLHKKRKLLRKEIKQIAEEKLKTKMACEKDNCSNSVCEEAVLLKEKERVKWKFTKFFRSNTFDFKKKNNLVISGKTNKSCEYEDANMYYKKSYSFSTQKSLIEKSTESKDEFLNAKEVLNKNFLTSLSDDEKDCKEFREKTEEFKANLKDLESQIETPSSPSMPPSLSPLIQSPSVPPISTTNEKTPIVLSLSSPPKSLSKETFKATLSTEGLNDLSDDEEQKWIDKTENEIMKLRESEYPDSAIRGPRTILLDMEALRKQLERTQDPFLSPVFATDSALLQINPISFVALHLDPLLDESIHMAKRFKSLGCDVTLDLVNDLPHGFLNFMHLSKEAYQASILCGTKLKRLIEIGRQSRRGNDAFNKNKSNPTTPESPANVDFGVLSSVSTDRVDTPEGNTISASSSNESYNTAF